MMLDQGVLERWMAGVAVPGVDFSLYEPVVITVGPFSGTIGAVVCLISLEPEALYTVELATGRGDVHLPASALTGA
jgi:hypothetical protein